MSPIGYIVEVTNLSPNATEKDVHDFFSFCGAIEHVEIVRAGEYACGAYVTFRDPYALETSVLLSGATIVDQSVCIRYYGQYGGDYWRAEDENGFPHGMHADAFISCPGEAVTLVTTMVSKGYVLSKDAFSKAKALDDSYKVSTKTQEIVKTMLIKGYGLSKDALIKAKAFDDSYKVSTKAAAQVADMSKRIGLTDKIKSVDEKYHVCDATKYVATTASAAATTVVNSSIFAQGALWMSYALSKAAKAAADLGSHGNRKSETES